MPIFFSNQLNPCQAIETKFNLADECMRNHAIHDNLSLFHHYLDENMLTSEMLDYAFLAVSTHHDEKTDELLQKLYEKGADVNAKNCFALYYACYCGLNTSSLERRATLLLNLGADPNLSEHPLLVRIAGCPSWVKKFLDCGVDPNQRGIVSDCCRDIGPINALSFAICGFRFFPIEEERVLASVQLLIEAGANPHRKSLGKTPIEHAEEQGLQKVVNYLSKIIEVYS